MIGFGLLVVILIGVAAGSAWQVRTHQSDLAAMEEHAATASLLQDAQLNANVAAAALQRYVMIATVPPFSEDPEVLSEMLSGAVAVEEILTEARAQVEMRGDEEGVARLDEVSAAAVSLTEVLQQTIALRQSGALQEAAAALDATVKPFRQFTSKLEEAAQAELQEASALRSRSDRAGDLALWLLVISGTIGAGLGLAASALIGRSILKPLSSLEATAMTVSKGDLSVRAQVTGPRELAHLGETLNSMMATVEQRTDELEQRTDDLRLANEELRQRNRQLMDARAQAATDQLTGLLNHRTFHERIRGEVTQAEQSGGTIGLIMLDIDDFKGVNDSLGHQAGDEVLRELALSLAEVVNREDTYRYGGDEFAVVLPGGDRRKAGRVAERLRRAAETTAAGNGKNVTLSLGVAVFPEMATSAEELIYRADMAMYWAKSTGKNQVGDWDDLLSRRPCGTVPQYLSRRGGQAQDFVLALLAGLAVKDPVTSAHAERCSWYTVKLAEELGLGEEETSVVRLAALLHDIGKVAIPDALLCKPGPLSEDEWAQMKEHPTTALHMLGHIPSVANAIPAILHHHEHLDGSGYPDGLAGDDIPIASRILLVADAFDAMTTDRPYRKAMPAEAAIEELKRCSGSQFDPRVVEAFLKMLSREGTFPLPGQRRWPAPA